MAQLSTTLLLFLLLKLMTAMGAAGAGCGGVGDVIESSVGVDALCSTPAKY